MPTLNGAYSSNIIFDDASPYITGDLSEYQSDNLNSRVFPTEAVRLKGSRIYDPVSQSVFSWSGSVAQSFFDLFYNRIHVLDRDQHSNFIDLKNLTDRQVRKIEVWNGYFVNKNLASIAPTNLTGTTISGNVPKTFAPLESYFYDLSVETSGTPDINGNYQFNFVDAEDPFLYVIGKRIVIMPFSHNWSSILTERIVFLTDVLESKIGTEQRIRPRGRPRRQYEYEPLLKNGQERAYYHNLMSGWQHRTFAIGIWSDVQSLPANLPTGSTSVVVQSLYRDFEPGSYLLIYQDFQNYEIIEIDSITANQINLKLPTLNYWRAGTAVLPARLAVAGDEVFKVKGITSIIESNPQTWNILVKEQTINRITEYVPQYTYRGFDVLSDYNDYSEDREGEIYRPLRPVDYQVGEFLVDTRYTASRERFSHRFKLGSKQQISQFYGWLDKRKGRVVPFWIPTYGNDMEIVSDAGATDTNIVIKDVGYSAFVADHPSRRDLAFVKYDGTISFKRIVGSGSNANGTENIALDSNFGQIVTPSTFFLICYLYFCRLDSDSIEIAFETDEIANVTLNFTQLLNSPS